MEKDKIQAAKRQMIDRHLIARGIEDSGVLKAMERVPREHFVPEHRWKKNAPYHAVIVTAGHRVSLNHC